MGTAQILRGLLSILLTAALVFSWGTVPVRAVETAAETTAEEQETLPPSTEETAPGETEEIPDSEETLPQETEEETFPQETEETIPPPTQAEVTVTPISRVKAMEAGLEEVVIEGTVVYADAERTVLQDDSGGICLTFPEELQLSAELVLRITGCRSADGFEATAWETRGRAALPEAEATIGSIPECERVVLKNVSVDSGDLRQGALTIPLDSKLPEGVDNGDRVTVWGVMVKGWFYADTVTVAETQQPPAETEQSLVVTATPASGQLIAGENIALHCSAEGASIYYSYSYDRVFYSDFALYSGGIQVDSDKKGVYVRAYAVNAGGVSGAQSEWYFTWEDQEMQTPETGGETNASWNFYFGQLHAHTAVSDGKGDVGAVFEHVSGLEGLDFFAVTDHSESFDNADAGSISEEKSASQEWLAGKAAADAVTVPGTFVGIFGYEMTWEERPRRGHINTFNTPGWQTTDQAGFSDLESYYQALTTVPDSISQFNHPGDAEYDDYGNFEDFGHYSAKYDAVIHLLEVGSGDGRTAYDEYTNALDAGWHVAPTNNQASRNVLTEGIGQVRTVVLAKSLSRESLFDAMRSHRVYATEDKDLEIEYYLNGAIMGSVLDVPAKTAKVIFRDRSGDRIKTIQVIADGGTSVGGQTVNASSGELTIAVPSGCKYYYLRITQEDGDIAVTAPVWVDTTVDAQISSFTADTTTPVQGQAVQLTLEIENKENVPFVVNNLDVAIDGQTVNTAPRSPITVAAWDSESLTFSITYSGLGAVKLTAVVTGRIDGIPHTCEATLDLRYQTSQSEVSLCTIAYARKGTAGQVYRVKGYVTAGTLNSYNAFPGMIYLQDGTGGIGVTDFADSGIQVGAPMELTGYLAHQDGNPVLELLNYQLLSEDYYNYTPETMAVSTAMNFDLYGGQLLQVEGQVMTLTRTADGAGVSRFTLRDASGTTATVRIDDAILSGAYGTNQLTTQVVAGGYVRAKGILHREADGTLVLRVRNCDEVTAVSAASVLVPVADPTNPKTGQGETFVAPFGAGIPTSLLLAVLTITAAGLAALYQMKKKQR